MSYIHWKRAQRMQQKLPHTWKNCEIIYWFCIYVTSTNTQNLSSLKLVSGSGLIDLKKSQSIKFFIWIFIYIVVWVNRLAVFYKEEKVWKEVLIILRNVLKEDEQSDDDVKFHRGNCSDHHHITYSLLIV